MKKLVIFSEESIFSGLVKCGIAEVVDSLANSLTSHYQVSVVCLDGKGESGRTVADFTSPILGVNKAKFLQVEYYLIEAKYWPEKAVEIIDFIKPDIFHNFYEPMIITKLKNKPAKNIYTFDDLNFLIGKENFLEQYSYITTFSVGYLKEIMKQKNNISEKLSQLNFQQVSIGVLDDFFSPNRGLLLPTGYNQKNQEGKQICKNKFLDKKQINKNPCLFLTMCRLIKEKGIDQIIQNIDFFKKNNSFLIIIGTGENKYENFFSKFTIEDGIIFIKNKAQIPQIPLLIASADFYLQPSLMETGGIMPMIASLYGTIPIVTQNGGLADNFNENNAIIVKNNLSEKLEFAISLYNNKNQLTEKREKVMSQNFSWKQRKYDFIKLYE